MSSHELFKWILPQTSARICRSPGEGQVFLPPSGFSEKLESCTASFVNMQKVWPGLKINGDRSEVDYEQMLRSSLDPLSRYDVQDLFHLLMLQEGVFGFWMDQENRLFLVCKTLRTLDSKSSLYISSAGEPEFRVSNFLVLRAMEVCEIFMESHNKRVIAGCISPQCLCSTEFLHIKLDVSAILNVRETLRQFSNRSFMELEVSSKSFGGDSASSMCTEFPLCYSSPEFLEGLRELNTFSNEKITCKTDLWILGCLLCYLLFGATPWDGLQVDGFLNKLKDHKQHADSWIQKRIKSMDSDSSLVHFCKLLLRCFSPDPEERPCASEIWQHLLCIQTSSASSFVSGADQGSKECCAVVYSYCLTIGCSLIKETIEIMVEAGNDQISESSSIRAVEKKSKSDKSSDGEDTTEVQVDITLDGHLGEVTCLTFCGEFILSR